jgi:nucleotide-binding universal stress UspA family protein
MTSEGKTECVVVGVDGSAESAAALAWAVRYAKAFGATVRAVFAWHYPTSAGGPPVGVAPAAVTGEAEGHMREQLGRAVADVIGADPGIEVEQKIAYGHAAQALIDESKDADLLVVGSRGHGAFTGMLLGSVSTHCVTHAACPVTVVRHG